MGTVFLTFLFLIIFLQPFGQIKPDTVKVGICITNIHDIDFRQKEYRIIFWLWLSYKNQQLDFRKNLEVPMAK